MERSEGGSHDPAIGDKMLLVLTHPHDQLDISESGVDQTPLVKIDLYERQRRSAGAAKRPVTAGERGHGVELRICRQRFDGNFRDYRCLRAVTQGIHDRNATNSIAPVHSPRVAIHILARVGAGRPRD